MNPPDVYTDPDDDPDLCYCPAPGCDETPICIECRCCPAHCCSHFGCGPEDPTDLNLED